jgi:hypothetical protein
MKDGSWGKVKPILDVLLRRGLFGTERKIDIYGLFFK